MAGGKATPRQKMINLMYLIFIAMLALNMGKEVLSAFGLMNEKLEASNIKTTENNMAFLSGLETKASENAEKFGPLLEDAKKIKELSAEYYQYLENLKKEMMADVEDPKDYQVMDKTDYLDQRFFQGDQLGADGKEFLDRLVNYRTQITAVMPKELESVKSSVKSRFETGDENGKVEKRDGTKQDWLNYNFEGYPLVASLTKITSLQADVKATEEDALKAMLQGQLSSEVSMTNYTTLLEQEKSAFYAGEKFAGNIVLGRKDATTKPNEVNLTLDGRKLSEGTDYVIEDGKVRLTVSAGSAGDHKIEGNLVFMQDGERTEVPVSSTFATITKPNAAVISADKMNVVYRGVSNPITISIPGIPDNNVTASAPGLSKQSGSKYAMNPGKGRTVSITASGKLPDGQMIKTSSEFRIKDIPRPSGSVRGESGSARMGKNNLEISTIGALLEDFDFDLNLAVSGFKFKVPGQPTVDVKGNKLDARAKSALKRASRGDAVQIFDIEAYITNNKSYKLKKVSPVVVEITN
ncbi:gliding motility protein GldM [Arenibacter sp. M-2]|uniref:type IX secretion system motor protein PorM/GldM n=1 Tax=unclassified Arenibacter TaxID=2615047 RepID=UPI000D762CC9|nr:MULTISPECIES: gliding motility protein GldM [unclassified Arenibacter]MDL5510837.1 gliding motility protein GldM [Arenibacter sp. M-2]PXX31740.1 protein involved in gliding motility GldM [Arenibacter sp. ARW7G5Y1]